MDKEGNYLADSLAKQAAINGEVLDMDDLMGTVQVDATTRNHAQKGTEANVLQWSQDSPSEDLIVSQKGNPIIGTFYKHIEDPQNCPINTEDCDGKEELRILMKATDTHLSSTADENGDVHAMTPRSTCSESCLHGYRKVLLEGKQKCCYYCAPCAEGEISNQTDMETCLVCPNDHWSNGRRDSCVPRPIEFLSYGDTLGSSLIIINLTFCLVTIVVFGIFIKNKDTPIVKANNQNLSFILLLSLIFSFLCPLLFIGRPSDISCLLRQVTFGIIFSLAVSSVLAKTVTVILAFQASKPGRTLRQWMKRHLSTSLLVIGSSGEVLICVLWLFYSPPFPDYNTEMEVGKIILQCIEGSAIAFYLSIGYIGFLAMMSFIVAFLARRLPDTFNEAQYITFSMLVFCSVWISFIPAYLSTKGKYMVAVEVFAILCSSAGLLGCIFIPKCYIILLRPELNTKSNIRVIRRHCTVEF
ncbi:vomeronasal type-2 receptor 26-like [Bufo gargarizans]|uniref:vomeronasal type-2 receptor 26-like n=1 Tax=Bufo gargarizans TaxID=30331 RepID=UPI001CF26E58|nr:vomeronasal type-2 receptor 26-like [Bufo gargarizans]